MDDRTVQLHQDELERAHADAENARDALIAAVKAWYPGWVTTTAGQRARENHTRVQELGADRVQAARARVDDLAKRADTVIDGYLGRSDPLLWPHLTPTDQKQTRNLFAGASAHAERRIRLAMGELAAVLIEGGIEPEEVNRTHPQVWDSRSVTGGRELTAAGKVELGDAVQRGLERYEEAAQEWQARRSELVSASEERSKNQAAELWGQ